MQLGPTIQEWTQPKKDGTEVSNWQASIQRYAGKHGLGYFNEGRKMDWQSRPPTREPRNPGSRKEGKSNSLNEDQGTWNEDESNIMDVTEDERRRKSNWAAADRLSGSHQQVQAQSNLRVNLGR